ncbi:hypothetical protein GCM10010464_26520 [Pseudonocardia yunnanensis]
MPAATPPTAAAPLPEPVQRAINRDPIDDAEWRYDEAVVDMLSWPLGERRSGSRFGLGAYALLLDPHPARLRGLGQRLRLLPAHSPAAPGGRGVVGTGPGVAASTARQVVIRDGRVSARAAQPTFTRACSSRRAAYAPWRRVSR